jgi:protein SCO1
VRNIRARAAAALVPLLAGAFVGLLAGCSSGNGKTTDRVTLVNAAGRRGVLSGTPPPFTLDMPAVSLLSPGGKKVDLRAATAGRVALVYFGYTHCPDVCPETMANLSASLDAVPAAVAAKVAVVFITIDPDRDTGVVLWVWARRIDSRIIALRGTDEQVRRAARLFGATFGTPVRQPDGTYSLAHSDRVIAFTSDGRARAIYPPTTQVFQWVHDLPILTGASTVL